MPYRIDLPDAGDEAGGGAAGCEAAGCGAGGCDAVAASAVSSNARTVPTGTVDLSTTSRGSVTLSHHAAMSSTPPLSSLSQSWEMRQRFDQ